MQTLQPPPSSEERAPPYAVEKGLHSIIALVETKPEQRFPFCEMRALCVAGVCGEGRGGRVAACVTSRSSREPPAETGPGKATAGP